MFNIFIIYSLGESESPWQANVWRKLDFCLLTHPLPGPLTQQWIEFCPWLQFQRRGANSSQHSVPEPCPSARGFRDNLVENGERTLWHRHSAAILNLKRVILSIITRGRLEAGHRHWNIEDCVVLKKQAIDLDLEIPKAWGHRRSHYTARGNFTCSARPHPAQALSK